MDRQPNFEHLCRVCAANTKGKNSVAECVYILKTPSLKEKIEKYLYLTISETDVLPKVLCKTCFRQVEATASLSKIAKHTQKVFRDFLFSTKPAPPVNINYAREDINAASEFTPIRLGSKDSEKESDDSTTKTILPPPLTASSRKDEVVVNVSVNEPLTRETQQKMINAIQKRQNSLDSRYTPASIAQRAFTSTPKQGGEGHHHSSNSKKPSPPGVINFFHGGPQQVTTFTSGGYVIGRVASTTSNGSTDAKDQLQQKRKNLKIALNNIKASNSGQVSLLKISQKTSNQPTRRSSTNSQTQTTTTASAKPKSKPSTILEDVSQVGQLPEKMIIAGPKQRKKHSSSPAAPPPLMPAYADSDEPTDLSQPKVTAAAIPDEIVLGNVIKDVDLLKLILKALKWPVSKQTLELQMSRLKSSNFAQIMSDPNLLQDTDLTQLLGPYLAPVFHAAHVLQQQQIAAAAAALAQPLTAAKVAELHSAALASAMPYKLPAETSVQLVPASPEDEEPVKASPSSQSLKRDAHRMEHLTPTPAKKMRRMGQKPRRSSSIIISDEEDLEDAVLDKKSKRQSSKSTPNFQVDIEPSTLFAQFGFCSGNNTSSSNDELVALLQRQKAALSRLEKTQLRKRSKSTVFSVPVGTDTELAFDADDIVLMEPSQPDAQPPTPPTPPGTQAATTVMTPLESTSPSTVTSSSTSLSSATSFTLHGQEMSVPVITRPIIKRRKTVIQASPGRTNLSLVATTSSATNLGHNATNTNDNIPNLSSKSAILDVHGQDAGKMLPPMPPLQKKPTKTATEDDANVIATQCPSSIFSIATQIPSQTTSAVVGVTSKATETLNTVTASAATSISSLVDPHVTKSYTKKMQNSKSALGQQLLEAIGLQKISTGSGTSDGAKSQVRSALKKSLQKAQEQQQQLRKQEEPITIQDADSTTKNVVKEIVHMEQANRRKCLSAEVDVEEEIKKITLVVHSRKSPEEKEEQLETSIEPSKKAPAASRIPGIRRKIVTTTRGRRDFEPDYPSDKEEAASNAKPEKDNAKIAEEKVEDNDIMNLSSPSVGSLAKVDSVTSTDGEGGKPNTPRKRGRKPKSEKHAEAEDNEEKPLKKESDSKESSHDVIVVAAPAGRGRPPRKTAAATEKEYEKEAETASIKSEIESASSTRPTRVSKTLSKYYKGPNTPAFSRFK